MPRLYKILVDEGLARSRTEAERFIRQGSVSVGGCDPTCSFFSTGKCTCDGWRKVTKATEEIPLGFAVKVGNGLYRVMKAEGRSGYDVVKGIGRSRVPVDHTPYSLLYRARTRLLGIVAKVWNWLR